MGYINLLLMLQNIIIIFLFNNILSLKCNEGEEKIDILNEKEKCTKCKIGKYNNKKNSKCFFCPTGKYSNKIGSILCDNLVCPEGKYKKKNSCNSCPINKYSKIKNTIECIKCKNREYQPDEGKTYCFKKCYIYRYFDVNTGKCITVHKLIVFEVILCLISFLLAIVLLTITFYRCNNYSNRYFCPLLIASLVSIIISMISFLYVSKNKISDLLYYVLVISHCIQIILELMLFIN